MSKIHTLRQTTVALGESLVSFPSIDFETTAILKHCKILPRAKTSKLISTLRLTRWHFPTARYCHPNTHKIQLKTVVDDHCRLTHDSSFQCLPWTSVIITYLRVQQFSLKNVSFIYYIIFKFSRLQIVGTHSTRCKG